MGRFPWKPLSIVTAIAAAVVVGLGASFTGILDGRVATVHGAWSVSDRLSSSYTGHLIRIRDVDDAAEINVGCTGSTSGTCDGTGSALDQAAIVAHCNDGTGVCALVNVQDQSGNDRDLSQATTTKQPLIFTGSALVTCGTSSTPCMLLDGLSSTTPATTGDYLGRADALGLTGNPGVSVWLNVTSSTYEDRFWIAIGSTGGAQYGTMTGGNGAVCSTLAGVRDYDANPQLETWGYYQTVWAASGTVGACTIAHNGSALSYVSGFNESSSPSLTDTTTAWGASTFSGGGFSMPGNLSTLVVLSSANAGDTAALQTWFAARN